MDEFDELAQMIAHEFIVRKETAEDYTAKLLKAKYGLQKQLRIIKEKTMRYEKTMQQWDYWRKQIAEGNMSSAPRDWFESILDAYYELIMAVEQKYPNESRHETALRYIRETHSSGKDTTMRENSASDEDSDLS